MRFFSAILVLFTLSSSESTSKDVTLPIEEFYNEISSAPLESNQYYLESGHVSALDLISQFKSLEFDEKVLEMYKSMDMINGMKEANEMMELLEKWKQKKTDLKDDVGKGLDELDILEKMDLASLIEKGMNVVSSRIVKIQERADPRFELSRPLSNHLDILEKVSTLLSQDSDDTYVELHERSSIRKSVFESFKEVLLHSKQRLTDFKNDIEPEYVFIKELSKSDILVSELETAIDSVKNQTETMEKLKTMNPKLIKVEEEMKVLEELRDSEAPAKIQDFLKNLEQDIGNLLKTNRKLVISENILEKMSPELENITNLIDVIDRKMNSFKGSWSSFSTDFTNIIPSENLLEKFEKLQSCLEKVKTNLDFTPEIDQFKKFSELIKIIFQSEARYRLEDFIGRTAKIRKHIEIVSEIWNILMENSDMKPSDEMIEEILRLHKVSKEFKNFIVNNRKQKGELENTLRLIYEPIHGYSFSSKWNTINKTNEKLFDQIQFLTCYTDLKTAHPKVRDEMIEIMGIPSKAFNYNVEPLENTVEVVNLMKGVYKMVEELKTWKFGSNNFPLSLEDVNGISEGVDVVKKILEIKNTWQMLKLDSDSDWKEVSEFVEKLSVDSTLTPPTIDISEYQGEKKLEILKFLKKVQNLGDYGSKLEKMNDGLIRMKAWKEEPTTTSKDVANSDCWAVIENPLVSPSQCESSPVLPDATSDDPIQEFQV